MLPTIPPYRLYLTALFAALAFAAAPAAAANPPASTPYVWKSVQMVGGGFVDGIVFHPGEKGLRYCRTDIGGAYRWDDAAHAWQPLLDWLPLEDVNLMGVEAIAVDPENVDRLYLACGMYTNATSPNAAILRSDDRGKTFKRADVPFKMGGNEDGRGNGERLMVDPNDGDVLYFGSRHNGLWRSTDRAVTWAHVESFPNVDEPVPALPRRGGPASGPVLTIGPTSGPAGQATTQPGLRRRFGFAPRSSGVIFVIFDPRTGSAGKPSSTIYVGISLMGRTNLFRSTDAGATWQPVPGEPTALRPNHGALAANGMMYLSYGSAPGPSMMRDGAVWKFNTLTSAWTDITPEKPDPANQKSFGYGAVAVDALNPNTILASTFFHPGGEDLFRSTDGGTTWKAIFHGPTPGVYDYSGAPYTVHTPIHWLLDVEIDPFDASHAMFTTGYGGWETSDLTEADAGKPTHWAVMSRGIEETVVLELLSPTRGAHLISAIGDYGGFVHWDLDSSPAEGNFDHPHFGSSGGVADAADDPDLIVRVGRGSGNRGGGNIGYSLDAGKTWQPTATPQPNSGGGHVAVSADGKTWAWTPDRSSAYFTRDRGATWAQSKGLPIETRVIADSLDSAAFYGITLFDGKLFTSSDGAATFVEQPLNLPGGVPTAGGDRGDGRAGQDRIYATPGTGGDLWITTFKESLFHSTDSGHSFVRVGDGLQEIWGLGFGKAAPGATSPALYLIAKIDGQRGVYRSDDAGKNWLRINDDAHQYGLLLQVSGDPRIYGRVYLGTHGRGALYGEPATPAK